MILLAELRSYLAGEGLVRPPDVAGAGPRPWPPPAWKHPDDGPLGPGDARDQSRPDVNWDDGLVVSLQLAPGIPPRAGEEEWRVDGVDIVMRGNAVPAIVDLEREIRTRLVGQDPGGRTDWQMNDLYVIQSTQIRPFQPLAVEPEIFSFVVGYVFATRAD